MAATSSLPMSSGHLVKKLRSLMHATSAGIVNAYIVPSGDAHQSEYLADCDMRRSFISKFAGSNGTAVITLDQAALWTDGRYHLQASQELDPSIWTLQKEGLPETPTITEWLRESLKPGNVVGVDPFLISHETWKRISKELRASSIKLVAVDENLVDIIWQDEAVLDKATDKVKPARPCNPIISLDIKMSGKDWATKVKELRTEMEKKKTGSIILTALDDIAWLLNLRGSDIEFNPVFFAYCIVTKSDVYLFIDDKRLTAEAEKAISAVKDPHGDSTGGVRTLPYDNIVEFVTNKLVPDEKHLVWISNRSSEALVSRIPKLKRYLMPSPVTKHKAIKNEIEVQNMRNCHVRDSAALCEYLAWLEQTVEANPNGHQDLWEIPAATYLENFRRQQENFMGLSFPSISAVGSNGSIIHYHPTEATRKPISKAGLYLIDSGAQYLDGTTDVTRTLHFGQPSKKEIDCFTRVLKGHIQLALTVFPRLAKGSALDAFARRALWAQGLDYMHGTGHGVGMFLNVHEGPASISPRGSPDDPGLDVGWILSNEPGFYEDGAFGIRIENLVVTRKAKTKYNFKEQGFLKFESLTLVPIQSKLIDVDLLTDEELKWLNEYHEQCRSTVGAHLDKTGKQNVKKWLIKETEKLVRRS